MSDAPRNVDAERALLGAVLNNHPLSEEAMVELTLSDFHAPESRSIFRAAQGLADEGLQVTLEAIRGRSGLPWDVIRTYAEAGDQVPNDALRAHLKEVQRVADLRAIHDACTEAMKAVRGATKADQAVAILERGIYGADREGSSEAKEGSESVQNVFREFMGRYAQGGSFGISTGLRALDKAIIGLRPGKMMVIAGRPGMGKALAVDEKLMTPWGPKAMGDIVVDDWVLGADGKPTRVTGVFPQGKVDAYRVTFDDGMSVVACGEHQWFTRTRADRVLRRKGCVRTTLEIAASMGTDRRNHSIPLCGPWELVPVSGSLPVAPYLLGCWLGDGDWATCPRISNSEQDIIDRCVSLLPDGDAATHYRYRGRSPGIRVTGGRLKQALLALGLGGADSFSKYVPGEYLYCSQEERLELLRGLMDTDGHVDRTGSLEFSTASKDLADSVEWLVRSLGGTCSTTVRPTHYVKDGVRHGAAESHRMRISFPCGNVCPVSSRKHLARWKGGPKRIQERFIVSVEPVGQVECQCISVDAPDSLYITEKGIVTHNTALADSIRRAVLAQGLAVVHFSLEMGDDELAERELAYLSRVNLRKIMSGFEVTPEELERINAVMGNLRSGLWYIDDKTYSIAGMKRRARIIASTLARQEVKVGLVIIDYLQLAGDNGESREQSIAQVSRGAKSMAKELGCTVAALSQLNRMCETRDDKRPMMSDLRESGSIEQDADIVLMVYRDKVYNGGDSDEAELIIRKQRGGPTGTVRVKFLEQVAAFEDIHCHHEGGDVPGAAPDGREEAGD